MICPECALDFRDKGSWFLVMVSAEGNRFKLIGQIQLIDAPNAAEFRGPDGKGGTKFQLIHSGLADEEGAKNQEMGWTSSLRNLEAEVAA